MHHKGTSLLILSSLISGATPVMASDADIPAASARDIGVTAIAGSAAALDEDPIIVTGRSQGYRTIESTSATKTETPLIDVPQSVSVVTQEQIEDQAFRSLGDALTYIPGVAVGQGEGHRDQITLRGQDSTADFFVDGVRDDVQYYRGLYNLARIEVLKGPNALIFGRGGGGGVINRVTKTPIEDSLIATGGASVNSFGAFDFAGDLNLPVGENAAVRVNGVYESFANHRDFYDGDRVALNPVGGVTLGESTRLLLSYEYNRDDRVVDRGVPSFGGEPLRGFRDTFFGIPGVNRTRFESHVARLRIEHEFSDSLRFDSTTLYGDYDKIYTNVFPVGTNAVDPLTGGAASVTLDGYSDVTTRENVFTQGNLVWDIATGGIDHRLLLGYEYGSQDSANSRRDVVFPAAQNPARPNRVTVPLADPIAFPGATFPNVVRNRRSRADIYSAYVQDQASFGEHFDLVAGLRYDRFELDVNDIQAGRRLSRIDETVSPRIGAIYKPRESISLYASYARSFLPASGDQFLVLSPTTASLEPERFDNVEVGAKWEVTPDLFLAAALYRLDRSNSVAPDPANPGNIVQTGETRARGLEIELTGKLTDRWQIAWGYALQDAEISSTTSAAPEGRDLPTVPRNQLSMWNRYQATDRIGLGLGILHQSGQFASISNSVRLPDYTRIDAAVFFDVTERIGVQLNIENLLDENYFPDAHNDNNISTGAPLNARLTLRVAF